MSLAGADNPTPTPSPTPFLGPPPLSQAYRLIVLLCGPNKAAAISLNLVLGIAPLLLAMAAQHLLIARFRRRIHDTARRIAEKRGREAAAAAKDLPPGEPAGGEEAV